MRAAFHAANAPSSSMEEIWKEGSSYFDETLPIW